MHFFSQGKWDVPLPKVKGMSENEVFKVVKTGKSKRKSVIAMNIVDLFFVIRLTVYKSCGPFPAIYLQTKMFCFCSI